MTRGVQRLVGDYAALAGGELLAKIASCIFHLPERSEASRRSRFSRSAELLAERLSEFCQPLGRALRHVNFNTVSRQRVCR